jgi:4-diphosphocytidyl-2-C-methyl-D-erythritol kinase
MINQPCFASGRGEILEQSEDGLSAYSFIIVYPNLHISTAWAFSQVTASHRKASLREIVAGPVSSWEKTLKNDFEEPVFYRYPALKKIKERLYEGGALYASMSGSGSSFYGIFEKNNMPSISFEKNFQVFIIK